MKKIYLFSLLLALIAGWGSARAEDYDYEWAKVTDLSEVNTGDLVLLVDENKSIALPNNNWEYFTGVSVNIKNGKIADENVDNIKWTLTKEENAPMPPTFTFTRADGLKLCGILGENPKFDVGATEEYTSYFNFDNYGDNGGELRYMFSNYLKWQLVGSYYQAVVGTSGDNITLFKRSIKNYVKWKRSDYFESPIGTNDDVIVVDKATERALANDKADNDPDAVAVTLNDDKDRILMEEVPEKLQWILNRNSNDGTWLKTNEEKYLYADTDKDGNLVLRVGEPNDNIYFKYSSSGAYDETLFILKDNNIYEFSVDESMFSNVWKLGLHESGNPDNHLVYYKRVEDPQKFVKIGLAEYYNVDKSDNTLNLNPTITGAELSHIIWTSSDTNVATVSNGVVTLKKRGSVVITAHVNENTYHDKSSAQCTVVIDDKTSLEPGSLLHPLTVAQAKALAENGSVQVGNKTVSLKEGVNYYIKGKVSKVNSGMMAMFGDMDFGAMMENMGGGANMGDMNLEEEMDDMDFDMDEMSEMGIDFSSFANMGFDMSAFFGSSDKVTYYISDDGTKDNQMKVLNGHGTIKSQNGGVFEFYDPDLTPGDCVIVCGPLTYTEDSNMFAGMMGNGDEEPKMSAKVAEQNYLNTYDPTLLITQPNPKEVYVNKTLDEDELYEIDDNFNEMIIVNVDGDRWVFDLNEDKFPEGAKFQVSFKSSDEEIAKWDETNKQIVGVNEGKAKITVKVKVILQEADENADPKVEEKSYTMKRKFKINVLTRDLLPAGYYDGDYVLTTSNDDLLEGTRLILVGTRVKDNKETDYYMGANNSMMGAGKNGSKIEINGDKTLIPCEDAPNALEVVLEKVTDETDKWYLNVGRDENDNPLYLYASDTSEDDEDEDEGEGTGGFDFKKIMGMFNSDIGLKVATMETATADSCKAVISIANDGIATISFPATEGKNNTIMLSSSFDIEEMMNMFGNMGEDENEQEEESSFDMSSFDMFMAAFNTKKSGEQNAEEGKEPKCFMPRIYRFVPDPSFNITFGSTDWRTIVTYKDVEVPENVEAYIVTKVTPEETQSTASLRQVEQLTGGEPYLLHYTSQEENFTMTLLTPYAPDELEAPTGNLLLKSNRKTTGTKTSSNIYVLANKSKGIGFYKWTGDELGAGRVYLPVETNISAGVHEYYEFIIDNTTAIQSIDDSETKAGVFYDLQGRRVDNPVKGIYIVNGKKVIVK